MMPSKILLSDDNLQYLLSMGGVKSMAEVFGTEPKLLDKLVLLSDWIEIK